MTGSGDSDALPELFVHRMAAMLGGEMPAFLSAFAETPVGLRVNTLRTTPEDFLKRSPFELKRLEFPPEGFLVDGDSRPGRHPYHSAGVYYLQDPSAMAVAAVLAPLPGERVLDLAAAPGGKTTHLAGLMANRGLILANDVQPRRAKELVGNLERCGVRNSLVTCESVSRLARRFPGWFDRVLVDAPCSGESMFHRSRVAREEWSPEVVAGCAVRQKDLLSEAASLVGPGGVLVYSTCTFAPEENEEVAEAFLRGNPGFASIALDIPGAEEGWPGGEPREASGSSAGFGIRLWPHRVPGAGHFIAAFRRRGDSDGSEIGAWRTSIPSEAARLLADFLEDALPEETPAPDRLHLRGSEVYQIPAGSPEPGGMGVLRPGLWLGSLLAKRFEPSHSLALAVRPASALRRVELEPDDPRVGRYLAGHPIEEPGPRGWLLVTVGGFALGWGKRVGTTVKNHYPRGLRWRS